MRKLERKRAKSFRRRVAGIFTCLFLALVISISFDSFFVSAKEDVDTIHETSVSYKSILIQDGDTLWNLAEEYITSDEEDVQKAVNLLKELNGLTDDQITAGENLLVPVAL